MLRPSVIVKRSLIFIHRWLGVALSLIFMLWFCSGVVMMYWSFPAISARDHLERAPVLDPAQIKISPEEAYAALKLDQSAGQALLTSFDGRPVYRFVAGGAPGRGAARRPGRGGAGNSMVYADDGALPGQIDDAMLDRAVSAWAKLPTSDATRESVQEVDQWTLEGVNFRAASPLYKYSFNDGQQIYISGRTADIVQYTTRESRFWAYLGAIPHWLYFTPLRKHVSQWFSLIVWTSGIGAIAALIGVVVAIWMLSPSQKYRYAGATTSIPYRGWKRWHMILGLFFGVIAVTWTLSGLLSMGPFEFVDRITGNGPRNNGSDGRVAFNPAAVVRGDARFDLAAYSAKPPSAALASLGGDFRAKELEFSMFAGEPQYMARDAAGHTRIIPIHGEPTAELDHDQMIGMLRESTGANLAEIRMMDQYDAYYLDRLREAPLPVIYVRMNDATGTRYYIDPKTGLTVGAYSTRNWVNRWLYHGLHSLDFPWLYNYRPLWDIVVITLMLGGTAICVTSLVLTYRVLARKLTAIISARTQQDDENLLSADEI